MKIQLRQLSIGVVAVVATLSACQKERAPMMVRGSYRSIGGCVFEALGKERPRDLMQVILPDLIRITMQGPQVGTITVTLEPASADITKITLVEENGMAGALDRVQSIVNACEGR